MVDESLLISIDRTALDLAPLVASGARDARALGISDYQEPSMQARVSYAPDSDFVHGSVPLSMTWQQAILGFSLFPAAETEAAARTLHAEVVAAISQALEFDVTVTVSDAPPETWRCNPGSITYPASRGVVDLRNHDAEWSITLPCHPVRSY